MFDDIPTNNTKGTTPSNLPLGEPEDMFSAVDTALPEEGIIRAESSSEQQVSQMSDEADRSPLANTSAVSAGILRPKMTTVPKPQSYDDHLDALVAPEMAKERPPQGSRIIFIIIASMIVVGLVGGVAYMVYAFVFAPNKQTVEPGIIGAPTTTASTTSDTSSSITADQVIDEESDREVLFGGQVDTDGDGIDDSIEQTVGTNSQMKDTDNDGLSDGDEILVWKTNPLNADTDGDGYKDGGEVSSGYSPLGPGKLFVSTSTSTTAVTTTVVTPASVSTTSHVTSSTSTTVK